MTAWHTHPAALALFDAAYAICHDGLVDFPFSTEAALEALRSDAWVSGMDDDDLESVISAWDKYCGNRDDLRDAPAFLGYLAEVPRLSAFL